MVEQEIKNSAAPAAEADGHRHGQCSFQFQGIDFAGGRLIRHGGGLEDFGHNLVGKIPAGRKNHLQMAGGVHDERAEIVIDGAVIGFDS